jgi:hypothetical protein
MANVYQVIDNCPDGANIGKGASDKVGFHGVTPVIQASALTDFTVGDSTNTMGAAITAINLVLSNLGLTA